MIRSLQVTAASLRFDGYHYRRTDPPSSPSAGHSLTLRCCFGEQRRIRKSRSCSHSILWMGSQRWFHEHPKRDGNFGEFPVWLQHPWCIRHFALQDLSTLVSNVLRSWEHCSMREEAEKSHCLFKNLLVVVFNQASCFSPCRHSA